MKLTCFILIIVLTVGYTAKMLAQKNDSISFSFETQEKRIEQNMPVPEIYSFIERVYLWNCLFSNEQLTNNTSDFGMRIRDEIKKESLNSLFKNNLPQKWNWNVTNFKKQAKFKGASRKEKKDYMLCLLNTHVPPYKVCGMFDWTLNNNNPFQRQQVRMNLLEFPKFYFFIQMLKFVNVLEGFIREVPSHYDINEQWRVSYRSDKIVLTYTY